MGNAKINIYITGHHPEGETESEFQFRVHKEQDSVDSTAPVWLSQADTDSLCDTASSQSTFDTAASNIGGSWYTWYDGLGSSYKTQIRYACSDLANLG